MTWPKDKMGSQIVSSESDICNGNCNIIPENKEKNREHEHKLYVI